MAKQSGGMPKIDEDFMRELISQGVPAKRESQPDDEPQPGSETETAHEGRQAETVQVEKPTPRKRKGGSGDYRETYFHNTKHPMDSGKLMLTINRQPIVQWFKEQWEKLQQNLRNSVQREQKSRGFRI